MSFPGNIKGHKLEITVIACNKLKDKEMFTKQDPYVQLEYGNSKFRTNTCKNGGKNPKFSDDFEITLDDGLREINVSVWNSNRLIRDDFIGSGRIPLDEVLQKGYKSGVWPLKTKSSGYAGELRLIMYYPNASSFKGRVLRRLGRILRVGSHIFLF